MRYALVNSSAFLALQDRHDLAEWEADGLISTIYRFVSLSDATAGDIGRFTNSMLARKIGWTRTSPDELVAGLVDSRWLQEHPEHRLIVTDWPRRCDGWLKGKAAKGEIRFLDCYAPVARSTAGPTDTPSTGPLPPKSMSHEHEPCHEHEHEQEKRHDHERDGEAVRDGDGAIRSRSRDGDGMDGEPPADSDAPSVAGRIPADSFPAGMTKVEDEADPGPDPPPVPRDGRTEALALLHVAGVNGANRDRLADVYADDPAAVEKVVRQVHADGRVKNPAGVIVHRLEKGRQLEPLQRQRRGGAAAAVADIAPDVTRGVMAARRRAGGRA